MRLRKVDANGDMTFGNSRSDFWVDVPDAPAQLAVSRLHLELGEWFLDTSDGTPWRTEVLGKHTEGTRDAAVQARLLGTNGVSSLAAYSSILDRDSRAYTVTSTLDTVYGRAVLSEPM